MSEPRPEPESLEPVPAALSLAKPSPDRLGIVHLLLWTAATAAILAFHREFGDALSPDRRPAFLQLLLLIVGAMLWGASMASLAVFVLRWWKRFPALSQPGHGLLLLAASRAIGGMLGELLISVTEEPYRYFFGFTIAWQFVDITIGGLLLLTVSMKWRWRTIVAAMIFGRLLMAISVWQAVFSSRLPQFMVAFCDFAVGGTELSPWSWSSWGTAIIVVSAWDIIAREHHDWLHWVGVGTAVGFSALAIVELMRLQFII